MLKKGQKGFTLIELLVVIAIIGLLSSVILASLNSARVKGRDARRLADLKQLQTALELYYNDNNKYPIVGTAGTAYSVADATNGMSAKGLTTTYIGSVPDDPSGSSQHYYWTTDGTGQKYCIGAKIEGASSTQPASSCSTAAYVSVLNSASGGSYNVGP